MVGVGKGSWDGRPSLSRTVLMLYILVSIHDDENADGLLECSITQEAQFIESIHSLAANTVWNMLSFSASECQKRLSQINRKS